MRAALLAASLIVTAGAARAAGPALETDTARQSYALGADLGKRLRALPVEIDPAVVGRGVQDALTGGPALLDDEGIRLALEGLNTAVKARQAARFAAEVGATFLQENGRKEGVVTLPSGLQYRVLAPGKGKPPRATDLVEVQWRQRRVDGAELDSSYRRGAPTTVKVDGDIIAGWKEALHRMPVGARWELAIPPELAYGEQGSGLVGANTTLVYELELVAVR